MDPSNFGDGRINAYTTSGTYAGQLKDNANQPIELEGLWGITFGNDTRSLSANKLYFTAGPNDEQNGLIGSISVLS